MSTEIKAIGTKSQALDWKLLLRGFAAYSRNDDERAIENWRRVNTTRPCGKIAAAALALVGDSSAAATPASWKRIGTLLQNDVVIGLAELAHELDNTHDMRQALRIVKQRRTMFQIAGLLEPIGNVLYHAMFNEGEPRDIEIFLNLLPAPPRDPDFMLLGGLILARAGDPKQSSVFLKKHAEWLSKHQAGWPADIHRRAIAKVIIERANLQLEERQDGFDPFAFFGFEKPKSKPSANILPLLRQAQLADPDWHDLTLWVVRELPRHGEAKQATEMGAAYLAKHPDTWAMCHGIGVAYAVAGDWTSSLTFQARAAATDPLNPAPMQTVGWIASITALKLLLAEEDEQAKGILTKYETPIRDNYPAVPDAIHFMILLRQKDYAAAEKLQAAALKKAEGRAEFIYLVGVLVTQIKVKADVKKAVSANLTALWTAMKTKPVIGPHLLNYWKMFAFAGVEYKGIKTHFKSILAAMIADDPKDYPPQVQFVLAREFIGYRMIAEAEVLVAGLKKAVVKGVTSLLQASVEEGKHPDEMNQEKIDKLLDDAERSLYRAKPELGEWLSDRLKQLPRTQPADILSVLQNAAKPQSGPRTLTNCWKFRTLPTTRQSAPHTCRRCVSFRPRATARSSPAFAKPMNV